MPRIPMTPALALLARIALIVCALIAFALAIMPSGQGPANYNDKLVHAVTFFGLSGLAAAGFRTRPALALFCALAGFGGLIEIVQWATDWGRSAEWGDLAADLVGISLGILVARLITCRPGRA